MANWKINQKWVALGGNAWMLKRAAKIWLTDFGMSALKFFWAGPPQLNHTISQQHFWVCVVEIKFTVIDRMRGQGQHRGNNVWNMCVIASQGEPRTITFMPIKSRGHQRNCLSSDINFSQMKRGHQQDVSGIELSKCVHIQTHSFTFKCVSFVCRLISLFSSALHKFILGAWGTIIYFQEKCQVQRIV